MLRNQSVTDLGVAAKNIEEIESLPWCEIPHQIEG